MHSEFQTTLASDSSTVSPIALEALPNDPVAVGAKPLFNGNLELIGDVKVQVRAVVGETDISVAELFALSAGSTLKLSTLLNAPIDLYLENKLIARGELVAVDEHFGISITEVESQHASI